MTLLPISSLLRDDYLPWAALWGDYLAFYGVTVPEAQYEHTWTRLGDGRMHGVVARDPSGRLLGLAHYLFHEHGWTAGPAVYLQDLFVDDSARGQGLGRMLIEAVADAARAAGAERLYWLTNEQNTPARALYDRVARFGGFIKYDYAL